MSIGGGSDSSGQLEEATASSSKTMSTSSKAAERTTRQLRRFTMKAFNKHLAPQIDKLRAEVGWAMDMNAELLGKQTDQFDATRGLATGKGNAAIESYLDTAKNFSTEEFAGLEAQRALGKVAAQGQVQQGALDRSLRSRGVDPGSGQAVASLANMKLNETIARAGASNQAYENAKKLGIDLQRDASSVGAGLNTAALQQGAVVGDSAVRGVQAGATGLNASANAVGVPLTGLTGAANAANQTYGTASSYNASALKAQTDQENAESGGFGDLIGTVVGAGLKYGPALATAMSDRRLKRDIKLVGKLANGIQLYSYEYVWGGGRKIGVMADEVEQVMPEAVMTIRGYKAVHYAMLGV